MIIVFALLLFVLGLFFNALILNWVAKKFKAQNTTFKNALKISLLEWLATILMGVIIGIVLAGSIGNVITWILSFFVFNLLCKKFYSTKLKKNIFIYLILNLIVIAVALSIILPFRAFVAQPFYVTGSAMSPTLNDNDYIIIKMFDKNYERGDIIIHKDPKGGTSLFIKRIIGLPGEKIQIKDNVVYIYNNITPSGQILNEPYLSASTKTVASEENVVVFDESQYYVLGDNREISKDSRVYGSVDKSLIIGKYWFMGMRSQ